jgi:hypothetical protein
MKELKLGQKVSFSVVYKRYSKYIPTKWETYNRNRFKFWKKIDVSKQKGIVIGLRTLSNGNSIYDSEYGYIYSRKESIKAVLVSTSLRSEILKVPLEDIIGG